MKNPFTNRELILSFALILVIIVMIVVLIFDNKKVKVEVTESNKISKYTLEREDSLRNVYELEKDSIAKTKIQFKTEIKIIYKDIKDENTTIDRFANRDSLWAVANKYITSTTR